MIQTFNKNTSVRLYYTSQSLNSGESVVFTIWDDSGVHIITNDNATEISNSGIYYYDIVTPNYDTYVLVKSNLISGANPAGQIYKVGDPTDQKVFFISPDFMPNEVWVYSIYNIDNTVLKFGNLSEVNTSGFYYVLVSDLSTTEELFFEVGGYVGSFFITTGVVIGGSVDFTIQSSFTISPIILYAAQGLLSTDSTFIATPTVISPQPVKPALPFVVPISAKAGGKSPIPVSRYASSSIVDRARTNVKNLKDSQPVTLQTNQHQPKIVTKGKDPSTRSLPNSIYQAKNPVLMSGGFKTRKTVAGNGSITYKTTRKAVKI